MSTTDECVKPSTGRSGDSFSTQGVGAALGVAAGHVHK
tara:strand:- start:17 stop:130 length:114 start_codon:yes stop_codon:yes gene_type:complete